MERVLKASISALLLIGLASCSSDAAEACDSNDSIESGFLQPHMERLPAEIPLSDSYLRDNNQ